MELEVIKGDITKVNVDVIVNAANTSLLGGGEVDGAIHRAGGGEILDECKKIRNRQGGCKVGEVVHTTAGKMNAQYVIHTVGPRWNGGKSNEREKLKNCYVNTLLLAEELGIKTIAFPNISTGIYKFPKIEAAQIAITAVSEHESEALEKVSFICFDDENLDIYKEYINNNSKSLRLFRLLDCFD